MVRNFFTMPEDEDENLFTIESSEDENLFTSEPDSDEDLPINPLEYLVKEWDLPIELDE